MTRYSKKNDTDILDDAIDTLHEDALQKLRAHGEDLPAIGMRVQAINAMRKLIAERKRSR